MNWGLFPTTERTFIRPLRYAAFHGPLAQLVEQGTLNPKVEGSIPSRPIAPRFRASARDDHVHGSRARADSPVQTLRGDADAVDPHRRGVRLRERAVAVRRVLAHE